MIDISAAHNWLVKNSREQNRYAGKWIAVTEKGILSAALTLKRLREKIGEPLASQALLVRIPTQRDLRLYWPHA